jgi:hypothetical protein
MVPPEELHVDGIPQRQVTEEAYDVFPNDRYLVFLWSVVTREKSHDFGGRSGDYRGSPCDTWD